MTEYNARIEWRTRTTDDDPRVDELVGALIDYRPAVSRSERGWINADITLPAENLRQALSTALAIATTAGTTVLADAEPLVLEVMPTTEFDQRNGIAPVPGLVSVTDAAAQLGISRQAVLQRLKSGSLAGSKVGKTWVVQAASVAAADPERLAADLARDRAVQFTASPEIDKTRI
ncbi:helix-turn-helix domain-containing protein [Cellulosimicrobium marinum]|uniref:helix-turn-helix domain-containing protein n=1 Tax=Cellulosimicrobium marinum TaxID=1638992 RepID=UPI001E4B322C|nr:helix-turn-helix domain-containing protein [Cellulosimicrobium marinum]MCB7135219.1 helix-turn-helix domain-containing protein [Cellulosimicrobium marinum]